MNKKTALLALSAIIFTFNGDVHADFVKNYWYNIPLSPIEYSRIGTLAWASGGSGVAERGLGSAVFSNPACMSFSSLTVSTELGYRKSTDANFYPYRDVVLTPTFFSLGTTLDGSNFAISYANTYKEKLEETIIESSPDGRHYTFEIRGNIHSFLISASHSWGIFSGGFSAGINYVTRYQEIWVNVNNSGSSIGGIVILGALFNISESIAFGISGKASTPNDTEIEFKPDVYNFKTTYPVEIEAGLIAQLLPAIAVAVSVEYKNLSDISPDVDDIFQFHAGSIISLSEKDKIRIGFFTQPDPYISDHPVLGQNFLTGGFQKILNNFSISLTIMDSHIFKNYSLYYDGEEKEFHQTILSLGASYMFE